MSVWVWQWVCYTYVSIFDWIHQSKIDPITLIPKVLNRVYQCYMS
jgi:hypothetical protein